MRHIKVYILFVFVALLPVLTACEREEMPGGHNAREVKLFAKMGVHLSVSQKTKGDGAISSTTRQTLDIGLVRIDENLEDGNKNQLYPYFKNYQQTYLTATLTEPNENEGYLRDITDFNIAQFFRNSQDEVTYAAWYPWPKTETTGYEYSRGTESTPASVTFPITGDSDIMYSNAVSGSMSEPFEVMQFNHALSLFRIHAYKSTNEGWGKIKRLSINSLPDVCTITLPKDRNTGYKISYSNSTNNSQGQIISFPKNEETADIEIPTGFDNNIKVTEWILAPSPSDSGLKMLNFSVVTQLDGENKIPITSTESVAAKFEPGYIYDIILRFSDNGIINSEIQISDWIDGGDVNSDINASEMYYNLSSYGTANCYIVSSSNFGYCFNATVKGNGNSDAMGGGIDATLNPKFVDVVWANGVTAGVLGTETGNTKFDLELETNKIVEGKVLFRINGSETKTDHSLINEGNVLLGVYDKEGEGRKCLWTWHIWITDKPQDQNYMNGYIVLDRNLGATAAAPEGTPASSENMKGLFYQWGRPTPFHIDWDSNVRKYKIHGENSYTRVTPDVAVQNPLVFYGRFEGLADNTEQPGNSYKYPLHEHDWVDRTNFEKVDNLWGYRETEHQRPIKTMYDPCPHGYHVPYSRTWEKLNSAWALGNKPTTGDNIPEEGVKLKINETNIWYPLQGYIDKDGVYQSGHIHILKDGGYKKENIKIVEVWSSLINRHEIGDIDDDTPYRFLVTKDYGVMLSDQYSNRTRGLAVRCVSNNTADVVKDLSASQTANCYMVHEDGYYKFKTTVRGNGVGSLLPLGGTTTAEINGGLSTTISPARVDILWWQGDFTKGETDFPTEEKTDQPQPANICMHLLDNGVITNDGYVAFQITNFQEGNYVLAAYDQRGEILWTWHIWLTDKPKDKVSGNYTKMDRFLGATHAPEITFNSSSKTGTITWGSNNTDNAIMATLGFYYQWGRKDPIIGPPSYNSGTESPSNSTVASSGWWIKNSSGTWDYRKSIDVKNASLIPEVVKDPTAFYTSTSTGADINGQWFPSSFADGYTNVALWGYAVKDYSQQGQTFSKTMHDPCPPGYRTPFHFSWRYDGTYKYADGDGGEGITSFSNGEEGFNNYGMVTTLQNFELMWYPYAGYRGPQTGRYTDVGTRGYMNTGMPMGQYGTRSFLYGYLNVRENWTYVDYGSRQYAGRHGSAYGKMVRCIKE